MMFTYNPGVGLHLMDKSLSKLQRLFNKINEADNFLHWIALHKIHNYKLTAVESLS